MIHTLFAQPAVLLDLETTGASPARDRITEIGLVDLDGSATWSALVNPGVSIPAFIAGLTGIDDAMVEQAPPFAELAAGLLRRLDGRLLIAHNVRFDYGFLRAEFERAGVAFAVPQLCSAKLSRKLYPQHYRHNLDSLIERHGIACADRHRALADAQVIGGFLQAAVADLGAARVAEVAAALITPASAPRPASDLADELPERPGCFILRAADGAPLYVGSGASLRSEARRLLQRSTPLGRALLAESASVEVERRCGVLGAALAEHRLAAALVPRHQRGRRTARQTARECWQLVRRGQPSAAGDPAFVLVEANALEEAAAQDAAGSATHFGDFPDARTARAALVAFAREHRLCPPLLGLADAQQPCRHRARGECRGACEHPASDGESPAQHLGRALTALARLPRPIRSFHSGRIGYREVDADGCSQIQVFDGPRYLGAADDAASLARLLEGRPGAPQCTAGDATPRAAADGRMHEAIDPQPLRILNRLLRTPGARIERIRL